MSAPRSAGVFRQIDALEYAWCLRLNRGCHKQLLRQLFVVVSRLGDGVFWYSILALLPVLFGSRGVQGAVRMMVLGLCGLALYKWLKRHLVRERPCVSLIGIVRGTAPLDRYSFPSGHTLHAVSFSTFLAMTFPALAWICVPFAVLVAASRVVLGLHYPTDVLAGALIGATLAILTVVAFPLA